jgi:hypothetical protein
MNRREAVVGMIALPFFVAGCGTGAKAAPGTLSALVDAIIPAGPGGAPGALAVGADNYIRKLVDDCYEQDEREKFRIRLKSVEDKWSFASSTLKDRQAILQRLEHSTDKGEQEFFAMIKRETIKGFTTSQQVMVNYLNYKIAPGHYYGCV